MANCRSLMFRALLLIFLTSSVECEFVKLIEEGLEVLKLHGKDNSAVQDVRLNFQVVQPLYQEHYPQTAARRPFAYSETGSLQHRPTYQQASYQQPGASYKPASHQHGSSYLPASHQQRRLSYRPASHQQHGPSHRTVSQQQHSSHHGQLSHQQHPPSYNQAHPQRESYNPVSRQQPSHSYMPISSQQGDSSDMQQRTPPTRVNQAHPRTAGSISEVVHHSEGKLKAMEQEKLLLQNASDDLHINYVYPDEPKQYTRLNLHNAARKLAGYRFIDASRHQGSYAHPDDLLHKEIVYPDTAGHQARYSYPDEYNYGETSYGQGSSTSSHGQQASTRHYNDNASKTNTISAAGADQKYPSTGGVAPRLPRTLEEEILALPLIRRRRSVREEQFSELRAQKYHYNYGYLDSDEYFYVPDLFESVFKPTTAGTVAKRYILAPDLTGYMAPTNATPIATVTYDRSGEKESYKICSNDDQSSRPRVLAGCGHYFLFEGDHLELISNETSCLWQFRFQGPTVHLNFGVAPHQHRIYLSLENRTVQTGFSTDFRDESTVNRVEFSLLLPPPVYPALQLSASICVPEYEDSLKFYDQYIHTSRDARDERCGQPNGDYPYVNGMQSQDYLPWHALVLFRVPNHGSSSYGLPCAGQLIASEWVLTSANCFINLRIPGLPRITVFFDGEWTGSKLHKTYTGVEFIMHPAADTSHDIALVRLNEKTDRMPVCLPPFNKPDLDSSLLGELATLVGWQGRSQPKRLMMQYGAVVGSKDCSHAVGLLLAPHALCSKATARSHFVKDATMLQWRDDRFHLRGIPTIQVNSWQYTAYTSVAYFLPWISNTTGIAIMME